MVARNEDKMYFFFFTDTHETVIFKLDLELMLLEVRKTLITKINLQFKS